MIVSLSRRKKGGVLSVQVPPTFALDTDPMKEFEVFGWLDLREWLYGFEMVEPGIAGWMVKSKGLTG